MNFSTAIGNSCRIDLPVQAYLPETYLTDTGSRIAIYRRLAQLHSRAECEQLQRELSGVANTWSLEVVRKISKRLQEELSKASSKVSS